MCCKNVLCNIITNIAKIMKTDAFQCSALAFAVEFVFIKVLNFIYAVLALFNFHLLNARCKCKSKLTHA